MFEPSFHDDQRFTRRPAPPRDDDWLATQSHAGASGSLEYHKARRMLRDATRDCRLLGGVFVGLGALLMLMLLAGPIGAGRWLARLMVVSNSVMLVGPGVWYITAATFIKRAEPWSVRVSLYVAAAQFLVVGGGLLSMLLDRGEVGRALMIPACLNVFFLPALAALVWYLIKARRAMNLMIPMGRAFEPLAVQPRRLESQPAQDTDARPVEP